MNLGPCESLGPFFYGFNLRSFEMNITFILLFTIFVLQGIGLLAQEDSKPSQPEKTVTDDSKWEKAQITVIGAKEKGLKRIPGSATIIDSKELNETRPTDNMEALRMVPGAAVRYQDPAGLTMNLGFRGVSNEVSRKVLILEDGIPVSLNPYGEPEMYYTPTIERMEKIEIVKGSGSILFGPSTIGGVVNLITRKPSAIPAFYTHTLGGENGYFSTFTGYGGTFGTTGVDVSILRKQGNGFRDSQNFKINEFNLKTSTQLNEKHSITLKFGVHQQESQATYLGLTTGMFNGYGTKVSYYNNANVRAGENPLTHGFYQYKGARSNPAQQDKRVIERWSFVLGHEYTFAEKWKLITKVYGYGTKRNWARQEYSRNTSVGQLPPTTALILYDSEPFVDRPGDSIWMRNTNVHRDRNYLVGGIESRVQGDFSTGSIDHEIDLGLKYEYNRANVQLLNGPDTPDYAIPTGPTTYYMISSPYSLPKSGTLRDDELRQARAAAGWIQDRIKLTPRFAIIPGVRYESIRQTRLIQRGRLFNESTFEFAGTGSFQFDKEGKSGTQILLPGFGTTYDITNSFTWFAGAHRGFAPARYESAISPSSADLSLKPELSWNYETGVRGDLTKYFYAQLVGYYLDFQEQIVNSSAAGGNLGSRPVNGGKSLHRGAEATLSFDLGKFFEKNFSLALETNFSLNDAKSNQYTYNATAILQGNTNPLVHKDTNGNYLPYVSREVYGIGLSLGLKSGFYARVDYQHFSKQYHDLSNTKTVYWYDLASVQERAILDYLNIASDASGTNGIIPAYGLLNASLGFKHPEKRWSVFINGKNLQDKIYISTRLPEGIQPGPMRQINVGFSLEL
jgi:Fe(3+) dicitrate transport protein